MGDQDVRQNFLSSIASQTKQLSHNNIGSVIITSGAVKLGKILTKHTNSSSEISKIAAAHAGFDPLMQAWCKTLQKTNLIAVPLTLTGQNFTVKNLTKLKNKLYTLSTNQTIIANTHDAFNSPRFKHFALASNNDMVGEKLALLCAHTYIICTNVDGVLDKNGHSIRHFQSLEQLKDIVFYKDKKTNGTGGMETKLWSAIRFAQTGGVCYIVSGHEQDVLLKIARGETVGTKVQLK